MQWPAHTTALWGGFFLFLKKEKRYFCRVVASKSGIVTETSEGARTKFP